MLDDINSFVVDESTLAPAPPVTEPGCIVAEQMHEAWCYWTCLYYHAMTHAVDRGWQARNARGYTPIGLHGSLRRSVYTTMSRNTMLHACCRPHDLLKDATRQMWLLHGIRAADGRII